MGGPNFITQRIKNILIVLSPNYNETQKYSEHAQNFIKFIIETASDASMSKEFRDFCYDIIQEYACVESIEFLNAFYPQILRAIIDCQLYQKIAVSGFISLVNKYEKDKKEQERKERAY